MSFGYSNIPEKTAAARALAADLRSEGYDIPPVNTWAFRISLGDTRWSLSFSCIWLDCLSTALMYDSNIVHISSWGYWDIIFHKDQNFLQAALAEISRMNSILGGFPDGNPTRAQAVALDNEDLGESFSIGNLTLEQSETPDSDESGNDSEDELGNDSEDECIELE